MKKAMNNNYIMASNTLNKEYKAFLSINDYYKKIWKDSFLDLFSASTFSNVVPEVISEIEIINTIKKGYGYNKYPSPDGNIKLILEFQNFLKNNFKVSIESEKITVCNGAMQAIDSISSIIGICKSKY